MTTFKKDINHIIYLAYDDDMRKYRELVNLVEELNETQLKELSLELNISQVDTSQTIYDYICDSVDRMNEKEINEQAREIFDQWKKSELIEYILNVMSKEEKIEWIKI
jgi:ethanolamine ammonia-lyase large subunit